VHCEAERHLASGNSDGEGVRMTSQCKHAGGVGNVTPVANGCFDCLQTGDTWGASAYLYDLRVMSAAVIHHLIGTPRSMQAPAGIQSRSPSSRQRIGTGATSIRLHS
jgi:hypothetical protein